MITILNAHGKPRTRQEPGQRAATTRLDIEERERGVRVGTLRGDSILALSHHLGATTRTIESIRARLKERGEL